VPRIFQDRCVTAGAIQFHPQAFNYLIDPQYLACQPVLNALSGVAMVDITAPYAPRVAIGLDAVAEELAIPPSNWAAAGRSATACKIFWSLATTPVPRWYRRREEKPG